ncbi:hypothetical protein FV226_02905 [Methylobacterium sp. WL12]|uniref:AprI/Inh family metalloprotease inhibitor n=1 Tax=Methylobacterium sp. WL12 TaxID=2603890 RepID=UPI0011C90E1C|nr:AprI/Inh family metalloprotease inhibitor [Methylobacterium sp. WL12]TXM75650.1 hypothetical protein FV226_02905 [Methylobacterium sp. WL12]
MSTAHSVAGLRFAAGAWLALAGAARAQEPPAADSPAPFATTLPEARGGVPGTWDLSRDGTNRRCVMTLSSESGEAGQVVRFPAGCRRAVPVVGTVAGWLFADGVVRLVDRNVRPVLAFAKRPDQRSYVATAASGESYSLVPLEIAAMGTPSLLDPAPVAVTPPALAPSAAAPEPVPTPAAAPGPGIGVQAGIYALDRLLNRDVCRLDLGGGPGAPVHLLPNCRDTGIEVFDPATWRTGEGRMTLVAKRGHVVNLVPAGDGTWRRDPETGVAFVLRRIDP